MSRRVGPYHDRVQRHADKISNHNDKLISYTDKGLGSTLAVCAFSFREALRQFSFREALHQFSFRQDLHQDRNGKLDICNSIMPPPLSPATRGGITILEDLGSEHG